MQDIEADGAEILREQRRNNNNNERKNNSEIENLAYESIDNMHQQWDRALREGQRKVSKKDRKQMDRNDLSVALLDAIYGSETNTTTTTNANSQLRQQQKRKANDITNNNGTLHNNDNINSENTDVKIDVEMDNNENSQISNENLNAAASLVYSEDQLQSIWTKVKTFMEINLPITKNKKKKRKGQ